MQLFARNNTVALQVFYFRDAGLGRAPRRLPAVTSAAAARAPLSRAGREGDGRRAFLPSFPRPARGKRQ